MLQVSGLNREHDIVDLIVVQIQLLIFPPLPPVGSLGDLDSGEENTLDNLSLSGEEGGASDPDDSAEGDSSSPPPFTPLYNEGERRKKARYGSQKSSYNRRYWHNNIF